LERVEYPQKVEKEESPSTKEEKKEKTGKIQISRVPKKSTRWANMK